MKFRLSLCLASFVMLAGMVVAPPASAHPSCSNVDDLEDWIDNRSAAGETALENHQFSVAFRLSQEAADAGFECGADIVGFHVQHGVDAGNNDEDSLRKTWNNTNYTQAALAYDHAAKAALALHRGSDYRDMIGREKKAWVMAK